MEPLGDRFARSKSAKLGLPALLNEAAGLSGVLRRIVERRPDSLGEVIQTQTYSLEPDHPHQALLISSRSSRSERPSLLRRTTAKVSTGAAYPLCQDFGRIGSRRSTSPSFE